MRKAIDGIVFHHHLKVEQANSKEDSQKCEIFSHKQYFFIIVRLVPRREKRICIWGVEAKYENMSSIAFVYIS